MTHAGCGLFAGVCLTGIGTLPHYAPVMVAHIQDVAVARPYTTRLTALSPRAVCNPHGCVLRTGA